MAKRTTLWRPDICDCVFEYEWDDTTDENNRVHTPLHTPATYVCAAHAEHRGKHPSKSHDAVLAECRTVQAARARLVARRPDLCAETTDPVTGAPMVDLKPEHRFAVTFDKQRKPKYAVLGLADKEVVAATTE